MKNKKGFTLTEMMVVVLILAGLAAVAYPVYSKIIMKTRIAEAISLGEIVREAQQRSLALTGNYFNKFTNDHVSGKTRLVKSNDFEIKNGKLVHKKRQYIVSITDVHHGTPNGCIVIDYGGTEGDPMFTVYMHVEDSRIWCTEMDENNRICEAIRIDPDFPTNDCETN